MWSNLCYMYKDSPTSISKQQILRLPSILQFDFAKYRFIWYPPSLTGDLLFTSLPCADPEGGGAGGPDPPP